MLKCSFCGTHEKQIKKLIVGPGVHLQRVHRERRPGGGNRRGDRHPLSATTSADADKDASPVKCSFCGKRRHQVSGLAVAAGVAICTECPALCHDIITEELA